MKPRPMLKALTRSGQPWAGFTLIETIVVVVLLAILAVFSGPKAFNSDPITVRAQAQNLASELQRAQLLATTKGQNIYICTNSTSNAYAVRVGAACNAYGFPAQPSASDPVVVALENSAKFTAIPSPDLQFDSLGQPNAGGAYKISASTGGISNTVTVAALTGMLSITSP